MKSELSLKQLAPTIAVGVAVGILATSHLLPLSNLGRWSFSTGPRGTPEELKKARSMVVELNQEAGDANPELFLALANTMQNVSPFERNTISEEFGNDNANRHAQSFLKAIENESIHASGPDLDSAWWLFKTLALENRLGVREVYKEILDREVQQILKGEAEGKTVIENHRRAAAIAKILMIDLDKYLQLKTGGKG